MPRPNILLVIADDHRADAIGAMGHPAVRTPFLDEIARRGTVFTRAGIMGGLMAAVCSPSRACLFSGRSVFRADAAPKLVRGPEYQVKLATEACTLPQAFRDAGYATYFTGKWHNDVPALLRSFEQGHGIFQGGMCSHTAVPVRDLDDFRTGQSPRVVDGFSTDIFGGNAEAFLRKGTDARPFFACVAFTSPHDPRTPPAEFQQPYDEAQLPLPANFLPEHPFDNGELHIRDENLVPKPLTPENIRSELAAYYGMISQHDAWIGRLLRALQETGQADNTIVAYVSDHGLAIGSHGLLGKQNLYEHSVRTPFLLAGPGVPAGARCPALAYSFDLYATLCDLAQVPPPAGIDSRSLVPALALGASGGRPALGALYMDFQRMMTDGRWKLIVYHVGGRERIQLFDLESDPDERCDLSEAAGHADHLSRLREQLQAWQRQIGDRWWTEPAFAQTDSPTPKFAG